MMVDEIFSNHKIPMKKQLKHSESFDTLQIDGEFGGRKVFSDSMAKEVEIYSVTKTGKNGTEMRLSWKNDSIMKLNSYNYNIVEVRNWVDDELGF